MCANGGGADTQRKDNKPTTNLGPVEHRHTNVRVKPRLRVPVCSYLHCCSRLDTCCAVTRLVAESSREAADALQRVPDVGQEGAQRPLLVASGAALHGLQADAAQRVSARPEVKGTVRRF